jgi:cytochrome c biogenesis protein CcmG, thiol:disulfide interchange protein DsbE
MKKHLIVPVFVGLFGGVAFAQDAPAPATTQNHIPVATVQTIDGDKFSTADFQNNGKPMVIDFWATWCKPCIKELNAINEHYEEWQEKTGVKIITISVDDERTIGKVGAFVNAVGWEYDNYLDPNSEFKRAMNVVNVPHLFVVDGQGNIVSQHTSYAPGDEEHLLEELIKLSAQAPASTIKKDEAKASPSLDAPEPKN